MYRNLKAGIKRSHPQSPRGGRKGRKDGKGKKIIREKNQKQRMTKNQPD
jgi:hypothetical protein